MSSRRAEPRGGGSSSLGSCLLLPVILASVGLSCSSGRARSAKSHRSHAPALVSPARLPRRRATAHRSAPRPEAFRETRHRPRCPLGAPTPLIFPARSPFLVLGAPRATRAPPTRASDRARPVLVLLHGVNAPADAECRRWGRAGAARLGWLLCPRGVAAPPDLAHPSPSARFTFGTAGQAWRQTWAGVRALRQRAPHRVAHAGHVLVGFSLGALIAPWVADQAGGFFRALVLVEGVPRFHHRMARRLAHIGVRRVAFLCGDRSHTHCRRDAPRRAWFLRRQGIKSRIWVLPHTGHATPRCFAPWADRVLSWALGRRPDAPTSRAGTP